VVLVAIAGPDDAGVEALALEGGRAAVRAAAVTGALELLLAVLADGNAPT
jgi:hypothetical protein